MKTKTCSKCGEEKPNTSEFFHKRKETKDGLRKDCKICAGKRVKKHREENRDKCLQYSRDYYKENKDKVLAGQKTYYKKNKKAVLATNKRWADKNKQKVRDYQKQWAKENQDRVKSSRKKSYEKNKEKILADQKIYKRRKRIESGKPLDSRAKPDSLYIGYIHLTYGTFFKIGVTSFESMEKRYRVDCKYRKDLVAVDCIYFQHIGADTVYASERHLLESCKKQLGEPIKGKEWFNPPTIKQLVTIMESVHA
jgi:hypothetical protein